MSDQLLWSGPILCRLFNRTHVPDFEIGALGSGGFLMIKGRYFIVTAEHVVRVVQKEKRLIDVVLPYDYVGGTRLLTLIKHEEDKDRDIAVIEVKPESAQFMEQMNQKSFLDESLLDEDPLGYFSKISNVVFLHGISSQKTIIDYDNFEVDMTTTPYTTFIDRVDEASNRIVLIATLEGVSEFGLFGTKLPVFNGMSGSFAYSYRRNDEQPFRCLGVLTNGSREAGYMWVVPITEVIEFIEEKFFD